MAVQQLQGVEKTRHFQLMYASVQVWRTTILHGVFSLESPKPQWLYSNDETLLTRLHLAAGSLPAATRAKMSTNEPLVKRVKKDDGTTSWTGDKNNLKKSQRLACAFDVFCVYTCFFVLGRRVELL